MCWHFVFVIKMIRASETRVVAVWIVSRWRTDFNAFAQTSTLTGLVWEVRFFYLQSDWLISHYQPLVCSGYRSSTKRKRFLVSPIFGKYIKYPNTSLSLNLARKYARILLLLSAPRGEQFSICGLRGTDKANIFHDVRNLTSGEYHWVSLVLAGAY